MLPRTVAALCGALVAAGLAQAPSKPQAAKPKIPVFTASTHLVQVPVIVDGSQGAVAGLTADDFRVRDNGKPQQVRFFVASAAASSMAAQQASTPGVKVAAFSNTPTPAEAQQPHSTVVILLDDLNSTLGMVEYSGQAVFNQGAAFVYAKNRLADFVRQLPSEDRVALYGLTGKLTLLSDFSGDRRQLLSALLAYKPVSLWTPGEPADQQDTGVPDPNFDNNNRNAAAGYAGLKAMDSGRITMNALRAIANHLALVPGRVSLVWLTADPAVAGQGVAAALGSDKIAVYPVDARGLLTREGLHDKTMCDCFPLSPRQMIAYLNMPLPGQDALRDVAEQTGGEAFLNTNDIAGAIAHAAQDSETSYMLGFYVSPASLDNTFHRIQVSVQGHGLHARYPRGYWALADNSPMRARTDPVALAIASPNDVQGIALQATVKPVPGQAGAFRMNGTIAMGGIGLARQGTALTGTLLTVLTEQNPAGAVLWRGSHPIALRLDDNTYAHMLATGLPFEMDVKAEPGATTLRLIIEDPASGSTGSLIIPVAKIH